MADRPPAAPAPRWFSLLFLGMGLFILGIGLGIVPTEEGSVHAPPWVISLCGAVFFLAGLSLLAGEKAHINSLIGALIGGGLGAVGLWVAFQGSAEHMSGGIPFVPRSVNIGLGRVMFGFGGLIGVLILLLGLRQFRKGPRA